MEELDKKIADKLMDHETQSYSTDVTQAFRVLNKVHKKGYFWRLDSVHDGVICTLQNIERKTFSVRADTVALAICETVLRIP
jgi:Phage ABA sandwich domain